MCLKTNEFALAARNGGAMDKAICMPRKGDIKSSDLVDERLCQTLGGGFYFVGCKGGETH
jgi:hypothetical protein